MTLPQVEKKRHRAIGRRSSKASSNDDVVNTSFEAPSHRREWRSLFQKDSFLILFILRNNVYRVIRSTAISF